MAEKFEKAVNKAVAWLAAEYKYMKEITEDLEELKRDLAKAKKKEEGKDIKKALRDFRYVGKCERRLARHERVVEEGLEALEAEVDLPAGSLKEIKELMERIKLEAKDLIKNASLREGYIKEKLLAIREAIEKGKLEEVKKGIEETEKADDDSSKWIAALSSDLSLAKRYHGSFIREHAEGMSIVQIKRDIVHLSPEEQIIYLGEIFSRKGLLAKKTAENVKTLIGEIGKNSLFWRWVAEAYEKGGEWKLAGDAWLKWGSYNDHAAKDYEKAGEWKLAGDNWLKWGCYDKAAEACIKGGMKKAEVWKLVGDDWIKRGRFEASQQRGICAGAKEAYKAAEAYIKGGMEKAKAWKLVGDALMVWGHYDEADWDKAAEAYEKAGEWKLVGDAWMEKEWYGEAARAYEKAGEWKLAGDAYEKAREWKLAYEAWNKAGKSKEANQAYQKAKAAGQI